MTDLAQEKNNKEFNQLLLVHGKNVVYLQLENESISNQYLLD